MSPKEVATYVRMCKKHGVSTLKVNGLELTIDLSFTPVTKQISKIVEESTSPSYTDEDLLLWSTANA